MSKCNEVLGEMDIIEEALKVVNEQDNMLVHERIVKLQDYVLLFMARLNEEQARVINGCERNMLDVYYSQMPAITEICMEIGRLKSSIRV